VDISKKPVLKFLDGYEFKLCLIESGLVKDIHEDMETYNLPEQILEGLFIKRQKHVNGLRDHRKASDTESQWRGMKYKMVSAIRRFHKSTEGRRLHRKMSRFLATREPLASMRLSDIKERNDLISEIDNLVGGLNEFYYNYYHHSDDLNDLFTLREDVLDKSTDIINKLIFNNPLDESDVDFFKTLTNTESIIDHLKEFYPESNIQEEWDRAKINVLRFMSKDNPAFTSSIAIQVVENIENN
jgi:hypothetical protein